MASTQFHGKEDLQFASLSWLLTHQAATLEERRQMVETLDLKSGDVILDVGCGPGLWTPLLAANIAPSGSVIGLDFSIDLIKFAQNQKTAEKNNSRHFAVGSFLTPPFRDQSFDAVFFANCLVYVPESASVLERQVRLLKNDGMLIVNHFDDALVIYHPIDSAFSLKVLAATAKSLAEQPPNPPYYNYVGRTLHGVFKRLGLKRITTSTFVTQKLAPLSEAEKAFITVIARWQAELARPHLSEAEVLQWLEYFDEKSSAYILDRDDFYYCSVDVQTVGRRQ
jgi:ubiquinone/menaquinone biosynthesis C-methylase UbiE